MISELQGKMRQIQTLNSQPTSNDIFNKISAVQFNQSVRVVMPVVTLMKLYSLQKGFRLLWREQIVSANN